MIGIRKIEKCDEISVLEGEKGTFVKIDIPSGVILGQYVGNEMLHQEYQTVYNGTKEEMEHLTYLHGESLLLPNGQVISAVLEFTFRI